MGDERPGINSAGTLTLGRRDVSAPLKSVPNQRAEGGVLPGMGVVTQLHAEDPRVSMGAAPGEVEHGVFVRGRQQQVAVITAIADDVALIVAIEVRQSS